MIINRYMIINNKVTHNSLYHISMNDLKTDYSCDLKFWLMYFLTYI